MSATEQSDIENLADATISAALRETPEIAAQMGLASLPAFANDRAKLASYAPQALTRRVDLLREGEGALQKLLQSAPEAASISTQVFAFFLKHPCFDGWIGTAAPDFIFHDYPIKHKDGAQALALDTLTLFHEIESLEDAEAYLERLAALPRVFSEIGETFEETRRRGLMAPRSTLSIVAAELDALIEGGPRACDLFTAFQSKLEMLGGLDPSQKQGLLARAETEIAARTMPAIAALRALIDSAFADAPETLGIWRLNDGDAYYAYRLKTATTTDFSADDIHRQGLAAIAELHATIERAFRRQGLWRGDIASSYAALNGQLTPSGVDSEADRARILADCKALMAHLETALRPHFGRFPARACAVQAAPRRLEHARTTCYYPPSRNGARAGLFELNLSQERAKAPAERRIVAYHEAYPGHHVQLALAQEDDRLPFFRRVLLNAAYIEGWAKYGETLPLELGLDADPLAELYRLRAELISASNLALDTGIHARRWTREQALSFSMNATGLDAAMANYLVDRISVTPGQTCAYKLGLDVFRGLRNETQAALGGAFTLAAFHDLVLEDGALPLNLLEAHVREKTRLVA